MNRLVPPMPDPMPPGASILRRARAGLDSALRFFQAGAFTTGGVGRHSIPILFRRKARWFYTVREPDLIREVLVERAPDFPKSVLMSHMLKDLIGDSVFVANGETWRCRRAILDQALEQARVRDVFERMRAAADATVDRIGRVQGDTPVRIDSEMTHFAADVIFRTLFSEPISDEDAVPVFSAFERFQGLAYAHGMMRQAGIPVNFTPGAWIKRRAAARIRAALKKPLDRRLAQMREENTPPPNDIATSLILGRDPQTGVAFTEPQLLDEVAMLFLAGHETSANGLAWALYLLASSPEAQARVHAEVENVLGNRQTEFGDMKKLVFTRNVFREALRLYPPVAVITRDSACPEFMGDREIAPDSIVFVTPWVMHRQDRFWNDPHAFNPDRFDSEGDRQGVREAYLPFSMGPRVCPGAAFALQESALVLAMLVRRFEFTPAEGHIPRPVARLTLRAEDGVRLVVKQRNTRA